MPFANASAAAAGGSGNISAALMGGKQRSATAVFNLASDAAGTYVAPIRLPRGAVVQGVALNTSVSLGSATVAVGIAGTTGKYRAAAALTLTDQAVYTALNAVQGVPLAAEEQIILTTAVAALPASGRLVVRIDYNDAT